MPADFRAMEDALRHIAGIVSARIFAEGTEATEIHILSNGERRPKQVARDVESALAAQFGIEVDHRRISVAAFEGRQDDDTRILYEFVSLKSRDRSVDVEVGLRLGDTEFVGRASGPGSARNRRFLIAEATLEAARATVRGERVSLAVDDVGRIPLAEMDVVAVLVAFSDSRVDEPLVGSAYVRTDESEAIVRATLAALNRRLGFVL